MALINARVQRSPVRFTDPKMLVISRDEADVVTGVTDFVFDFTQAACYPGGVLPAVGAAPATGVFSNLARDVQPMITVQPEPGGRTGAVTTAALGTLPVYNGKGLRFTNGSTAGLQIKKAGLSNQRVCEPPLEGFTAFLEIVWFTAVSIVANTAPYARLNYTGGMQQHASGAFQTLETLALAWPVLPLNQPIMLAKIVRFDVTAGTSTILPIAGSAGVLTAAPAIAGRATAGYPVDQFSAATIGALSGATASTMNATIHRVMREYVGLAGLTDAELITRLRRHYAWGAARFA